MKHAVPPPRKLADRQRADVIRRHGVVMLRRISPAFWPSSVLAVAPRWVSIDYGILFTWKFHLFLQSFCFADDPHPMFTVSIPVQRILMAARNSHVQLVALNSCTAILHNAHANAFYV